MYWTFEVPNELAKKINFFWNIQQHLFNQASKKIAIATILNGTDEGIGPNAFPKTERVTGINAITNNK